MPVRISSSVKSIWTLFCRASRPAARIAARAAPACPPAPPGRSSRRTGSMRAAASPTSPSNWPGPYRSSSAAPSATASTAAMTVNWSVRGTSSRAPPPKRTSPCATVWITRSWPSSFPGARRNFCSARQAAPSAASAMSVGCATSPSRLAMRPPRRRCSSRCAAARNTPPPWCASTCTGRSRNTPRHLLSGPRGAAADAAYSDPPLTGRQQAAAGGIEEVPGGALLADLGEQLLIVAVIVHRIDRRGIHDQQRSGIVAVEEPRIRLIQLVEIAAFDVLLIADAALRDPIHQHIDGCLQVHHQIRLRGVHHHPFVDSLVQRIFRIIERHARKETIFFQQVVRHAHGAEQILLANLLQLPGPLKQKKQLRLKRRRARVLVEALEEWILIRLFEHELSAQRLPQAARQTGLADTDRTFDDNESVRYSAHHGTLIRGRKYRRRRISAAVPTRCRVPESQASGRYPPKDTGRSCASTLRGAAASSPARRQSRPVLR